MELDAKTSLQWVNLLAPSPQHHHPISRQHFGDTRPFYTVNQNPMHAYGFNSSPLVLDDTTAYKWYEEGADTYAKQQLSWYEEDEEIYSKQQSSMPYITDMKTVTYPSLNMEETKQMNVQCNGYQNQFQSSNAYLPGGDEFRSNNSILTVHTISMKQNLGQLFLISMLQNGNMWRSESSTSPSTLATTEEGTKRFDNREASHDNTILNFPISTELAPSPNASARIIPEQYSWQLETMSRQDLIKRLIHLETEKALQDSVDHTSDLLDNDMHYQINRTTPTSVSSHEAPISREVSRESLDRYDSLEHDQNVTVCLWHGCHQSFGNLDLLITHVRNIHVGRGKVRPSIYLKPIATISALY
jgi:hypothetical protein